MAHVITNIQEASHTYYTAQNWTKSSKNNLKCRETGLSQNEYQDLESIQLYNSLTQNSFPMLQAAEVSLDNSTQTRTEDVHLFSASSEFFTGQVCIHLYTNSQANEHCINCLSSGLFGVAVSLELAQMKKCCFKQISYH